MSFTDWIDGRIKVATTTAVEQLRGDIVSAVKTAIKDEIGALPGQITGAMPAIIQPAVRDELNVALPDLLSGNFNRLLPDIINAALHNALPDELRPLLDALNRLPHFPGFGVEGPGK